MFPSHCSCPATKDRRERRSGRSRHQLRTGAWARDCFSSPGSGRDRGRKPAWSGVLGKFGRPGLSLQRRQAQRNRTGRAKKAPTRRLPLALASDGPICPEPRRRTRPSRHATPGRISDQSPEAGQINGPRSCSPLQDPQDRDIWLRRLDLARRKTDGLFVEDMRACRQRPTKGRQVKGIQDRHDHRIGKNAPHRRFGSCRHARRRRRSGQDPCHGRRPPTGPGCVHSGRVPDAQGCDRPQTRFSTCNHSRCFTKAMSARPGARVGAMTACALLEPQPRTHPAQECSAGAESRRKTRSAELCGRRRMQDACPRATDRGPGLLQAVRRRVRDQGGHGRITGAQRHLPLFHEHRQSDPKTFELGFHAMDILTHSIVAFGKVPDQS